MKKTILSLAILAMCFPLVAQTVNEDSFDRLSVHYTTPAMAIGETNIDNTVFLNIQIPGYIPGGQIGTPALPQQSSLIVVPVCKGYEVTIENAVYDTITLPGHIMPVQPSISKSDTSRHAMSIDQTAYLTDAYIGEPLADVEYIGVARDRHLARLVFSPVKVNPVQGKAIVCRSADISVNYVAADEQATIDHFVRYNTPAYTPGPTLNSLIPSKYVSNVTPVRMAVVTISSLRCKKLEQFLSWKRQQGFRVDVYYIDELGIESSAAIDNTLANLFNNTTETNPAPAYLLIIGDVAQVPSHSSRVSSPDNDHITDLYYTTWTSGDVVPDCYHGRFSATDTAMLGNIIDKTLLYEQYNFDDDSYLARAALIAGVDQSWYDNPNDNAYTYADPAMDYIAKYYVNRDHGYDSVFYYKNRTDFAPDGVTVTGSSRLNSAAIALRRLYNRGAGWVNYSAHGNWDCWGQPEFTVSNVNSMTNNGKPGFFIGSCCLTNKFEKGACFGESLLRKGNNAGAIGYIGGSNSTYWSEDFYWQVGVRQNITGTMDATYDASNLGTYDHLFHTHNEALTAHISTAGQIMMFGNVAVQNSGSSANMKKYYWEIYHLMGDPSLMPWLGRADEPYVVIVSNSANTLRVRTTPKAYVAVVNPSDSMRVQAAAFADASGEVTLTLPDNSSSMLLSVNAQNHKPYSEPLGNLAINSLNNIEANVYPNPANDFCEVVCDGMQSITVVNALGQTIAEQRVNSGSATLQLHDIPAGVYMLRIQTSFGDAVKKLIVK